jgi:hypothetical protein
MPPRSPASHTPTSDKPEPGQPAAPADRDPARLDPAQQDTERTITRMADLLADALIRRLNQSRPEPVTVVGLTPRLVRDYQATRQTLAGPDDDEADVVGTGIIVEVVPQPASVGADVRIRLSASARPQRAFFSAVDGGIVAAKPSQSAKDVEEGDLRDSGYDDGGYLGGKYYDLVVEVPDGAITGPITVSTDDQPLTSIFRVEIEQAKGVGR